MLSVILVSPLDQHRREVLMFELTGEMSTKRYNSEKNGSCVVCKGTLLSPDNVYVS